MALVIVTVLSLLLAATMSVVAWRAVSAERRRAAARVAHLSADIRGEEWSPDLLDGPVARSPHVETAITVVLAVFVFSLLATLLVVLSPGLRRGGLAQRSSSTVPPGPLRSLSEPVSAADAGGAPLELIALHHEREADQLTVRGVIRNPASGLVRDHLIAVVLLFDADGGFISGTKANVAAGKLAPGSETTFAVTVPNAAGVGRYRVSFRTDNRVVPHVDRRT